MFNLGKHPDLPQYRQLVEAVREALLEGRLKPGQKLPSQLGLQKQFGINPAVVRSAYNWLEQHGIVARRARSGTYVQPDALQRIRHVDDMPPFEQIVVVIGSTELVGRYREDVWLITEILAGLEDVLGSRFNPRLGCVRFVESFNRACLGDLPDRSAVLLKRAHETDPAMLEELRRREIPVLGIWGHGMEIVIPRVDYNHSQAPRLAVEHLIDCGYRRIGFIGDMGRNHLMGVRFFEFTNTLFRAGMDFSVHHVREASSNEPGAAFDAVQQIIDAGDVPEAFYVDTDDKAMEVIRALNKAGLDVPGDVGIVSQNDVPEAVACKPALTTMRVPRRAIGRQAAHMLLAWARDRTPMDHTILSPELVVRETTRDVEAMPAQHKPSVDSTL